MNGRKEGGKKQPKRKRMEAHGSFLAPKRKPPSSQATAEGGWGFGDRVGGAAGGRGAERENTVVWEGTTPPGVGVGGGIG